MGVGLACGGSIEVFVERLPAELFGAIRDALRAERPAAVATVVAGTSDRLGRKVAAFDDGRVLGELDGAAADAARSGLAGGPSRRVEAGGEEIFVDVLAPSSKLVIVGGVHIAIALVTLSKAVGYRTILVDPREAFGNAGRFPHADQIVNAWPDRGLADAGVHAGTAVAVLTHDPKLDDPAILAALRSPAFYVGALGSRKTQEKRRRRLSRPARPRRSSRVSTARSACRSAAALLRRSRWSIMAEVVAVRGTGRGEGERGARHRLAGCCFLGCRARGQAWTSSGLGPLAVRCADRGNERGSRGPDRLPRLAGCCFLRMRALGVRRGLLRSDDASSTEPRRRKSSEKYRPDPIEARQLLAGCCFLQSDLVRRGTCGPVLRIPSLSRPAPSPQPSPRSSVGRGGLRARKSSGVQD